MDCRLENRPELWFTLSDLRLLDPSSDRSRSVSVGRAVRSLEIRGEVERTHFWDHTLRRQPGAPLRISMVCRLPMTNAERRKAEELAASEQMYSQVANNDDGLDPWKQRQLKAYRSVVASSAAGVALFDQHGHLV
jgi:hypothetical protein